MNQFGNSFFCSQDSPVFSRLVQYVKCYLFSPSGNGYDCPLAMADGVARLIEVLYPTIHDTLVCEYLVLLMILHLQLWCM